MIGLNSQRKAAQRFTGIAAGPKLISTVWLVIGGNLTGSVPAGAAWASFRVSGTGGFYGPTGQYRGGGGGGFSREDRACSPGQAYGMSLYESQTGIDSLLNVISLAGVTVCAAECGMGGAHASSPLAGSGGRAAYGIGSIRRSGGSYGQTGEFGGLGGAGNPPYSGGGSAGERDMPDCLFPGGQGGDYNTGLNGRPYGYGAGAGARSENVYNPGNMGAAAILFWSAKP